MKKFKDISDFEDLLKEQLSGHSTPAPPDVWSSVAASSAQSVSAVSQLVSYFSSVTNLVKVALFVGGIAAVGIVIYNENNSDDSTDNVDVVTTEESSELGIANSDESLDQISAEENKSTEEKTPAQNSKNEHQSSDEMESREVESRYDSDNSSRSQDGVAPQENSDIKPSEGMAAETVNERMRLSLSVSNMRPCVNEKIVLESKMSGSWSVNGKELTSEGSSIEYICKSKGALTFVFVSDNIRIEQLVFVQDLTVDIVKDALEGDNEYKFSLSNNQLIANWYLNSKLVATNAKEYVVALDMVGEYKIRVFPVNHSCSEELETIVEVQPVGSFKFINLFIPNNSGENDLYKVEITNYDNFSIQIFDASQRMVYHSSDPDEGWDGTEENTGAQCKSGEYIARINYQLKGENPTTKNKKLTLLRP